MTLYIFILLVLVFVAIMVVSFRIGSIGVQGDVSSSDYLMSVDDEYGVNPAASVDTTDSVNPEIVENPETWMWLIVVAIVTIGVMITILYMWKSGYLFAPKKQNKVRGLEISRAPRRLTYRVGDRLDLRGLRLNLVYEDDTREEVTDFKMGTIVLSKDTNIIEFTYKKEGVSAFQEIYVE